jgi:hypothetical protein
LRTFLNFFQLIQVLSTRIIRIFTTLPKQQLFLQARHILLLLACAASAAAAWLGLAWLASAVLSVMQLRDRAALLQRERFPRLHGARTRYCLYLVLLQGPGSATTAMSYAICRYYSVYLSALNCYSHVKMFLQRPFSRGI